MNSLEFCYWLQGFFEINKNVITLDSDQVKIIENHLQLVFEKKTPTVYGTGYNGYSGCGQNGTCGTGTKVDN